MMALQHSVVLSYVASYWIWGLVAAPAIWLLRNHFYNGLNEFPGPFLASLTDWWRFWQVHGGKFEVTQRKLHEKYGDVVRIGPRTLSFADPSALKKIYGLNQGFVKSDFYIVQQGVSKGRGLATLFSTTDDVFHAQLRRCVNSVFSMSTLVQYEPFVDSTTRLFFSQTEKLYADGSRPCDFVRWLQFYAFDVIGEVTYSERHGFIERDEDVDGIVGFLSRMFLYSAPIGQMPWLDRLFWKNPIYLKLSDWGIVDATNPIVTFAKARMADRLGKEDVGINGSIEKKGGGKHASSPDLLSKFIAARDARPDFMDDKLVLTMATSMAFAGSETTAISLSAVFYYLLRNPSALKSLQAELDGAGRAGGFSDNDEGIVTFAEAQRLPYLDACIKEAFRMFPAVGLSLERIVPEPGVQIAGTHVRGGTIVGCSPWVIHRRPEIFGDDVDVYRPERWLVGDETLAAEERAERVQRVAEMNRHMLHFGMGSRTCIGKNISLLEMYKLVPSFLRRFEMRFKDPGQDWKTVNAWFIKQENFDVVFEKRELVVPGTSHEKER